MLVLDDVRFGFSHQLDFLGPLSFTVDKGQCWAVVGPNGAGKSTLLRLMAGLREPTGGSVRYGRESLASLSPRDRARRIAFLPQHPPTDLDLTAREVVMLGRYPHRRFGLFDGAEDFRAADVALSLFHVDAFADRAMDTLSGGEAQRVHLAAALAQQPELLLLDEPTTALDLAHELAIFRLLRQRAERDGLAVVAVTHDVNLAARFCSHVVLLHDGRCVATGPPDQVLTPDVLHGVYGVRMTEVVIAGDRRVLVALEEPCAGAR